MIIQGKRIKQFQSYKVKGRDEYLYVWLDTASYINASIGVMYEVYATLREGDRLPSIHYTASAQYLNKDCRPVSFKQLPSDVQQHLVEYINS